MVTCPMCNSKQLSVLWSVVTTEDLVAVQRLRDQRLNLFVCDRCDHQALVDVSLLYHDLHHNYCIQYVSRSDVDRESFYANISGQGTYLGAEGRLAHLEEAGGTCLSFPHFVFSMREMLAYILFRDKCRQWGRQSLSWSPSQH